MARITRREMLGQSSRVAASIGAGLPLLAQNASGEVSDTPCKLKIVVAGAHPDDPESGCGGTIALYSISGHEVVVLYLTRGEAGIPGKTAQEAAAIRTAECQKACSSWEHGRYLPGKWMARTKPLARRTLRVCKSHTPVES